MEKRRTSGGDHGRIPPCRGRRAKNGSAAAFLNREDRARSPQSVAGLVDQIAHATAAPSATDGRGPGKPVGALLPFMSPVWADGGRDRNPWPSQTQERPFRNVRSTGLRYSALSSPTIGASLRSLRIGRCTGTSPRGRRARGRWCCGFTRSSRRATYSDRF